MNDLEKQFWVGVEPEVFRRIFQVYTFDFILFEYSVVSYFEKLGLADFEGLKLLDILL